MVDRVLELGLLQLDTFARGSDIGQCPTHLGELLKHFLVGEVEHVGWVLGLI
jgi:hypothetical protein